MCITKITDFISINNLIVLVGIILAFYATIYTTKKRLKKLYTLKHHGEQIFLMLQRHLK